MNFKVFTLGRYVDHEAFRNDGRLSPYKDIPSEQLQSDQSFFDAVVSPSASYDRSVLIKLAMTLKFELMIQGTFHLI